MKKIGLYTIIFSIFFFTLFSMGVDAEEHKDDVCIVSVALDVSGSMKRTDSNRDVIETIKMIMDVCDENDYFCITAYNDDIVYHSGIISTKDEDVVREYQNQLDDLDYQGDTDNGLGLLTATKAVVESGVEYDRAVVLLISDGNTDLINSPLNRTSEDSSRDIESSANLAKEADIPIYVIEYTNEYTADTALFSIVTSATNGGVTMVNEPMQFVQVMLNSFFKGYSGGTVSLGVVKDEDLIHKYQMDLDSEKYSRQYFVLYSQSVLDDFQILENDSKLKLTREGKYCIVQTENPETKQLNFIYTLQDNTQVVQGYINVNVPKEPEKVITETIEVIVEKEVERESMIPVGTDLSEEIYSTSEVLRYDVSSLFTDDDIIKYNILSQTGSIGELEGSVLFVDAHNAGEYSITVEAQDAVGNKAQAEVQLTIIPSWRQYYQYYVIAAIAVICLITVVMCIIIIKRLLFKKEKKYVAINGCIMARFIDLKSKNDIRDTVWDLSKYPPEGVSLEELFHSKGIKENLKDMDKLCFYPSEQPNHIIMVHCIEGGVFVGDERVPMNRPVELQYNDKIYISIAENASEIELTYRGI